MKTVSNENLNEPGCKSQNGRILQYLRDGDTITSLESLMLFRCMRCASRIGNLRTDMRHPISDVTIQVKSKDPETGEEVTKYISAYYIAEAFAKKRGIEDDKHLEDQVRLYATSKAQRAYREYYGE